MWSWSSCRWEIGCFIKWLFFEVIPTVFTLTFGRVAIIWFSPNHRNSKRKRSLTFCPSQQSWVAITRNIISSLNFILISKFYSKVCVIHFLNEISDFQSIFESGKISTNAATCVWVVQIFSWHNFIFTPATFPLLTLKWFV